MAITLPFRFVQSIFYKRNYYRKNTCIFCPKFLPYLTGQSMFTLTRGNRSVLIKIPSYFCKETRVELLFHTQILGLSIALIWLYSWYVHGNEKQHKQKRILAHIKLKTCFSQCSFFYQWQIYWLIFWIAPIIALNVYVSLNCLFIWWLRWSTWEEVFSRICLGFFEW